MILNALRHRFRHYIFSDITAKHLSQFSQLKSHSKIQSVVSLLNQYNFNDHQIDAIIQSIGKYIAEDKQLNHVVIKDTIDCWRSKLRPPTLRTNQLDKVNAEDIDFDMSVDFNHVVSKIEPKLLLMNANAIDFRYDNLLNIGIMGGNRDMWRVFVYAPNGYYLQDWTEFLKKFHYLNHQILVWLLDKKDVNNLHPHPIVRNSKVMELSFEEIKTRYLFAYRTGLKSVTTNKLLTNIKESNKVDLRALMLTPIEKFLKIIAPNCTPEEYFALQTLISENPIEEDEQIIEDVVELTLPKMKHMKKNLNPNDLQQNLENFQIISKTE
ncbi:uncharacterized protein LOC128959573 [Oppia nitens]|uniref:uncharacterized protein LOC128959573 n=1 Tax=Oppia nitens TaxID=1686743 RepID=UPI0023DC39A1|nr:uncharacterized protein LOC128959573 [Oppia nitens]